MIFLVLFFLNSVFHVMPSGRHLSASSKSHSESAAAQDFCQDEILPEKRALLQSSNTDNVILCRAVVSPRPHGQTAFCSLYLITVDSMPSPTCTASASPGFTSTTALLLLDVLVQSLYARDVND